METQINPIASSGGFVEEHEEQGVKDLIAEQLGFELPKPFGDQMLVKLFVRPEEVLTTKDKSGKEVRLFLPSLIQGQDIYRNCTALVVAMGPACYYPAPACRVGDFLIIPRNEGTQFNYRGHVFHFIRHEFFFGSVSDPAAITRNYGEK